jgi:hypothetical protein
MGSSQPVSNCDRAVVGLGINIDLGAKVLPQAAAAATMTARQFLNCTRVIKICNVHIQTHTYTPGALVAPVA